MVDTNKIIVTGYSKDWPLIFEELKKLYKEFLADLIIDIQHVGSTSVPGLWAKPIIDSDKTPVDGTDRMWPKHNLYCCTKNSVSLRNHLLFRDTLRRDPEKMRQYSELKQQLASQDRLDIDGYVALKR